MPELRRVSPHQDLHRASGKLQSQPARDFLASLEAVRPGNEMSFAVASRERCRMSKGSMLGLFELNGRGRSGMAVALPGQLHSQSGSLLPWTIEQPPCTGTQVRGARETDWWTPTRSVRPSSRASKRAEARDITGCW